MIILSYCIYFLIAAAASLLVCGSLRLFWPKEQGGNHGKKTPRSSALQPGSKENEAAPSTESDGVAGTAEMAPEETATDCCSPEEPPENKQSIFKRITDRPYTKKERLWIVGASFLVIFGVLIALDHYVFSSPKMPNEYINFMKLLLVLVITASAALIDVKTRKIPNRLIVTGLALRMVLYAAELIFCKSIIRDILINDGIGFAIGFGSLFLAGLISRGEVGFGDAKLFAVIGIFTGYLCTFGTLFWSLLLSAAAGIVLLIKYRNRKMSFPFAPFIFLGYAAVLLSGNF